jgi:transcription elongation factor Elf1
MQDGITSRRSGNAIEENDMEDIITCPQCDHEQEESDCFLGRLGWLTHFRCRYCGWQFAQHAQEARS